MRKILSKWLPAYAFLYIVFLYLPVVFLPIFSVNASAIPKFPLTGLTLEWYRELPNTPALLDAAWNSFVVATAAAILSTVLGICAARAVTRYRFPARRAVTGLIMAPLVLPEIIVAISLLVVLLQLGLSLSLFTVVLGHVLICIPYSLTVLTAGFEGFDRSLEEASADLGESAFGTFRRVTLPMVAPAIISS
ncbi:MAG: ABC transporter permease, partial [Pseudaminobacter sp.]|nr:ABC transporter permease [Pseudaminobacter sp.]